ncbi:MAG: biotin/lipoate A/B protein ligase family protein [Phycisphaerae bacterium]
MARDEALLVRVGRGESECTLRLYRWDPPTISLGYFQRFADFEALTDPAGSLAVVRRLTGGGAILHDLEVTYSLTVPIDHRLVAGDPKRLYAVVHEAVRDTLRSLGVAAKACGFTDESTPTRGPFFCFERRHAYDLLVGDEKIAGSAQRRTREAVVQHGSIILGNRYRQQQTAVPSVSDLDLVDRVYRHVLEHWGARLGERAEAGSWTGAELEDARGLVSKYAGDAWTKRR